MTQATPIYENGSVADSLAIERLEFPGYCGVDQAEREDPQPIAVDLDLEYPLGRWEEAAATADLTHTVDYAAIAGRVVEVGTQERFVLLETLADRILTMLFAEFPIRSARLWVRKVHPPVSGVHGSVGIRVARSRSTPSNLELTPASYLLESQHLLPKGHVLDVATGHGRNALYLASQGYSVEAIDRDEHALSDLAATAQQRHLANLAVHAVDLEAIPGQVPDLPKERYDVILVFFYLYRPLFPVLVQALRPGGVLLYETYLIENHLRFQHPRRQEFCLAPNELLRHVPSLLVRHYDEGEHESSHGHGISYTARLLAVREVVHAAS
ncbi:MAG: dihydroneopterin aldolase [Nitrospiraceae bacterium]